MKNKKGITLIALVITIIVLIILAGVTISRVVKNDGVIKKANNSARETAIASAQDEIENAINTIVTANLATSTGPELALLIDAKLTELAETGSKIKGITYSYSGPTTEPEGDSGEGDVSKDDEDPVGAKAGEAKAPEVIINSEGNAVSKVVGKTTTMNAMAASLKPLDEIRYFYVYYEGKRALTGELNMSTGSFDIFSDTGDAVKEPAIEKPAEEAVLERK